MTDRPIIGFDAKRIVSNGTGLGSYGRTLVNDLARYPLQMRLYITTEGRSELRAQVSSGETVSFIRGNSQFPPGKLWVWLILALLSCGAVVAMSYSFQSWLWIPVVIIIGTIALVKVMPAWLLRGFVWFGSLSAAMFVAHPIARKLFIIVAWKQDLYDGLMLYIIVTIALSWAVKQVIDRIPSPKL